MARLMIEIHLNYLKTMLSKFCINKNGKLKLGKKSMYIPILKKDNVKECSNYKTIVLTSHASKLMLKISNFSSMLSIRIL